MNQKSAKMAEIKKQELENKAGDVVERLYAEAQKRIEKQMNHTQSYNEHLGREYSF